MVVALFLTAWSAQASPVECRAEIAKQLLLDARIDESRAPVTHPWLVPGLALAANDTEDTLRHALRKLCEEGAELSIERTDTWEAGAWSAYTVLVARTEMLECTLHQQTVALTVGVEQGSAPTYSLRGPLPTTQTPIGDCPSPVQFREESILDGSHRSTRLVLAMDKLDHTILRSRILVRRATPDGWVEQILADPAPSSVVNVGDGPRFALIDVDVDQWIVRTQDHRTVDGSCNPVPGQTVWTWHTSQWKAHEGREAMTMLARTGHWRLAGSDAWFLLLAQDVPEDRDLLEARARLIQRRNPHAPLFLFESALMPELNAGFLIVAPAPFATEEEARYARKAWGRKAASYIKQAWTAQDPCVESSPHHAPAPAP